MDYLKLSLKELSDGVKSQKFTSEELVSFFISRIEKAGEYNAIIEVFDDALSQAKMIDEKVKKGETLGKLAGVPVVIKDNILCKGKHASCASKFMKDFISPYDATIVTKLKNEGAVILARANMDEFAMGGSCEKSIYGATANAIDKSRVAGGSSGGSAVAVALGLCPLAIGTDTGGSIRQPCSFNGVVGMKPTYGKVSRFGIVAFASSTDQAGPITRTIEDNQYALEILAGKDEHDGTSIDSTSIEVSPKKTNKIGICKEIIEKIKTLKQYPQFEEALDKMRLKGYETTLVSVPHILNSLACYYILTPAEATSNLARFDGVKYTSRSEDAKTIDEIYVKSRSEGFGEEVKRRIMLGNFVLSSGYFDAYYTKAKKLQRVLKAEFAKAFESCDAIVLPTTPDVAFKIGEKATDPVSMYLEDLFTVPASIAEVPAISVPYMADESGLPLGLQFIGKERSESVLYEISKSVIKEEK